ncbi:hypothetical protein [Maribellus sp. YY47]|uniref:hypothetical protein n=1 Tax=Maribellus sp. YY47 TaxID=2929486 RepID=UPI002000AC84|nr:hypothetical protein [Maribellus sp. YY47]MCK3685660.1 hypothetical protein [Maribellus sp. YY47]
MARKQAYQPVFLQFISEIEKGFLLLDEASQAEVLAFVKSQQHTTGAFSNRAGNPDLYYSLFGSWLSVALKLEKQQENLKKFTSSFQPESEKVVDKFSLLLINQMLENDFKKPSLFELIRWIRKGGKNLNTAYRFFLFMLSFDALYGKNRLAYLFVRLFLNFYKPDENLPCSFYASLLFACFLTGKEVNKEAAVLMNYFERGKGFKTFRDQGNADLLSTAVALFVLKKVGADLRMVMPDCLTLVQDNYDNGAFLSGDGDSSKDLEYSFYGLLTLGLLS